MSVSVPGGLRHSLGSSSRGDSRVSKEMPYGSSSDRGYVMNKSTKRRLSDSDAQPSRKKCHLMETRMDSLLKIPVISLRSRIVLKQKTARSMAHSILGNLKNIERSRLGATCGNKTALRRSRLLVRKRNNIRKIIAPPKLEHMLKCRKNRIKSKEKLHYLRIFATNCEEGDQGNYCQHTTAAIPSLQQTESPANYLFNANSTVNADEEEGFLSTAEIEQLNLDLGDTILSDSFLSDINGEGNESVSSKSQNNISFDDTK